MTPTWLLAFALALPGPHGSREPVAERDVRLERIVEAAWRAAVSEEAVDWPWSSADLELAALVTTWFEGWRWRRAVHTGQLKGDHGSSHCLGGVRLTPWVSRSEWRSAVGTDQVATDVCLRLTVRILSRHAARCRVGAVATEHQIARVFSAYGTGRCSKRPARWALERARTWTRWRERIASQSEAERSP